jgi:hypothetical protein
MTTIRQTGTTRIPQPASSATGLAFRTTRTGRRLSVAGAAYVAAWLVGLLAGPAAPAADAAATDIQRYYVGHGTGIVIQSILVHGIAGLALGVLAILIPAATRTTGTLRRAVVGTGLAAAVVSLAQVGFALTAVTGADTATAGTSNTLFDAINRADTVKLVLLAAFIATATTAARRGGLARRWLVALAVVTAVLLPLGGAAFLVDFRVLTAALYVSLPLLLAWAGAIAFSVGRRAC